MRNKKNIFLVILLLFAGSVVFWIYENNGNTDSREVDLYFFAKGGYALEAKKTEIVAQSDVEFYEKIADALINGPQDQKLTPIMNKSISLNYVNNHDGNLNVDFSREYQDEDLMTTYAVIKTYSGLPEVNQVKVTADGTDIKGHSGEPIGYVRGDEINIVSDNDSATGIRLYFANEEKNALVLEYRTVNITDTQPVEQYIVTELIKGPVIKDNVRLLAQDTEVLSVETTDGTCYVNFKQGFIDKNAASKDEAKLIIYSMVNSLTERDNVKNVQFLIEGKKTEKFGDMNISELFVRNDAMIQKAQITTK